MNGSYFNLDYIEARYPDLYKEWSDWLRENFDPGNYDSYKVKDQTVLPYVDGRPQWVTDAFMPAHLVEKLKALELEQQRFEDTSD